MNLPARFDHTFRVEVVIASIVFGLVLVVFLAAIIRSFTPWGRRASQATSHKKTETVYVSVVAAVAGFLVWFSFTQNTSSHPKPALTVNVTAFQWCWRFSYAVSPPVSVTANCVDGHLPTLVVPTNEPVEFHVTSADVVHSMWIPYLRFKLFAYPNYTNSFETTLSSTGSFEGECSEFCGEYHYAMHFVLKAVTQGQFKSWLSSQQGGNA